MLAYIYTSTMDPMASEDINPLRCPLCPRGVPKKLLEIARSDHQSHIPTFDAGKTQISLMNPSKHIYIYICNHIYIYIYIHIYRYIKTSMFDAKSPVQPFHLMAASSFHSLVFTQIGCCELHPVRQSQCAVATSLLRQPLRHAWSRCVSGVSFFRAGEIW